MNKAWCAIVLVALGAGSCSKSETPVASPPVPEPATATATAAAPASLAASAPARVPEARHFVPGDGRPPELPASTRLMASLQQTDLVQSFKAAADGYLSSLQLGISSTGQLRYKICRASNPNEPPTGDEPALAQGTLELTAAGMSGRGTADAFTFDLSGHRLEMKKGETFYLYLIFSNPVTMTEVLRSDYADGVLFSRRTGQPMAFVGMQDRDLAFKLYVSAEPPADPPLPGTASGTRVAPTGTVAAAVAARDPVARPMTPSPLQMEAVAFPTGGHYYIQVTAFNGDTMTRPLMMRGPQGIAPVTVTIFPVGGGDGKLVFPANSQTVMYGMSTSQLGPNEGTVRMYQLSDSISSLPAGDYRLMATFDPGISDKVVELRLTLPAPGAVP